jgi:hypothetical protein
MNVGNEFLEYQNHHMEVWNYVLCSHLFEEYFCIKVIYMGLTQKITTIDILLHAYCRNLEINISHLELCLLSTSRSLCWSILLCMLYAISYLSSIYTTIVM